MQAQPTYGCKTATLTVPAEYLEDMQSAIAREITSSSEMMRDNLSSPDDFRSAAICLGRDIRLLERIFTADGEIELTSEQDTRSCPVVDVLEQTVRLLAERLDTAAEYCPVAMGDVLEIADRLRWAATEAIRIQPGLGEKLNADDGKDAVA